MQAKAIADEANQWKAAALRQRLRLLLSKSVDERERQREAAAARAAESEALALVKECRQHEAAMRSELSAANSLALADERPRHKIASPNLFDAARARIQATCELLAGPLDAILADIEREDIKEGARTTPLVDALSLPSTVDGNIQKVRPRTQPRRRTG